MIEYHWVLLKEPSRWLVSQWDGGARWVDTYDYDVRPDLDMGRPVVARIGTGFIGQYYRFERDKPSIRARMAGDVAE